jgi:hypothetical protein
VSAGEHHRFVEGAFLQETAQEAGQHGLTLGHGVEERVVGVGERGGRAHDAALLHPLRYAHDSGIGKRDAHRVNLQNKKKCPVNEIIISVEI